MKLRKGDTIIVAVGRDKGKKGKIQETFPQSGRVVVAGVNIYKRHTKKRDEKSPGGIIEKAYPIAEAKVRLVCPKCGKMTRVGFVVTKGEKERICRKCKQKI